MLQGNFFLFIYLLAPETQLFPELTGSAESCVASRQSSEVAMLHGEWRVVWLTVGQNMHVLPASCLATPAEA